MRKVIAAAFVSLDGVMQAPGGPEEDRSGGFAYGGWQAPHWDDTSAKAIAEVFETPFDLLLGRRTYDIFAAHWPRVAAEREGFDPSEIAIGETFDRVTKYVATHSPDTLTWQNTQALGADVPAAIRKLKQSQGPNLLTQGSSELLQTLFAHDLVDEIRLFIYPLVLGQGKRFFGSGAAPAGLKLTQATVSAAGAIIATYERDGDVQVGSFAMPE